MAIFPDYLSLSIAGKVERNTPYFLIVFPAIISAEILVLYQFPMDGKKEGRKRVSYLLIVFPAITKYLEISGTNLALPYLS